MSSRFLPKIDLLPSFPMLENLITSFGYPLILAIFVVAVVGIVYLTINRFLQQISDLIGNNEGYGSNLRLEAQKTGDFNGSAAMWQLWKI